MASLIGRSGYLHQNEFGCLEINKFNLDINTLETDIYKK